MDEKNVFSQMDFGPLTEFLEDDDVTDISYSNGGRVWLKTLSKGIYQVERPDINNAFMEKLAFQCSNVMGKTFNMAHPFLDAESAELRLNFVHDSVARNGVACVMRKTPAKIRLEKEDINNIPYYSLLESEDGLFEQVHLDSSRSRIYWTDEIDLPSDILYEYGEHQARPGFPKGDALFREHQ